MSKDNEQEPKIGDGHASAMWRQGLRELRGALYSESNVAQQPEYGLYGTKTPGEVTESRQSNERDLNEEPNRDSVLGDRLEQLDRDDRDNNDRYDRDLDRE
jgi:hypothetical protein